MLSIASWKHLRQSHQIYTIDSELKKNNLSSDEFALISSKMGLNLIFLLLLFSCIHWFNINREIWIQFVLMELHECLQQISMRLFDSCVFYCCWIFFNVDVLVLFCEWNSCHLVDSSFSLFFFTAFFLFGFSSSIWKHSIEEEDEKMKQIEMK